MTAADFSSLWRRRLQSRQQQHQPTDARVAAAAPLQGASSSSDCDSPREASSPTAFAVVRLRSSLPPKSRWSLSGLLREAARQLLPEPRPVRTYRPPSEYGVTNGRIYYSDNMTASYEPTLFTKVFAAATLGLYIGVPNFMLALAVLSWWSAWARVALAVIVGTAFLPLRPLFWRRVMDSYVFLSWRRFFNFSFVFDKSLDACNDYVIAQFPHGAYPLGTLVGGTFMATEYPEVRRCGVGGLGEGVGLCGGGGGAGGV